MDQPASSGRYRAASKVNCSFPGQSLIDLNGGPSVKPNEAVSFMVLTDSQEETDRYWDATIKPIRSVPRCLDRDRVGKRYRHQHRACFIFDVHAATQVQGSAAEFLAEKVTDAMDGFHPRFVQ